MDHVVARRFAVGVKPWRDELTSLEAMSQNDAALCARADAICPEAGLSAVKCIAGRRGQKCQSDRRIHRKAHSSSSASLPAGDRRRNLGAATLYNHAALVSVGQSAAL